MKATELKLRIQTVAENLINIYFGENSVIDKLTNSTLKVLLKNNMYQLDDLLKLFSDKNGEIDAQSVINTYVEQFQDGIQFDIKKFIKNDFIRNVLPDKTLIITKDDIMKILPQERIINIQPNINVTNGE